MPSTGVRQLLEALYGRSDAEPLARQLAASVERWRGPIAAGPSAPRGRSQGEAVLIAYPDHLLREGQAPLATLAGFCDAHLRDAFSTVHVLPFHPSTSYEGYAITDYGAVDPRLGSWLELEALGTRFRLMMDLVLNHCSASHPWFAQFLAGEEPGRRYFLAVPDPEAAWLKRVYRARSSPLTHPFASKGGTAHVWTTYSPDLIDFDWRQPAVCAAFCDLLLESVAHGASAVRLDAFVYVWKAEGTRCINQPQCHQLVRLFHEVLAAAGAEHTAILPSITNVTQAENFAYLASWPAREADLVYNLPLAALALEALYAHDATHLRRYVAALPPAPPGRAYLNLVTSHDGVGLTWLKGLLPDEAIARLIAGARARGARLSSRHRTAGGDENPWELNATAFSACRPGAGEAHHLERFLAVQAIALALRGVPAVYFGALVAAQNDDAAVLRTGDNRAINRGRLQATAVEATLDDPQALGQRAFASLTHLLRVRRGCPAFHPEAGQRVIETVAPELFAVLRTSLEGDERVLCLTHFSPRPRTLEVKGAGVTDLMTGRAVSGLVELGPYQTAWLRGASLD